MKNKISTIIGDTSSALIEAATGIGSTDKKELIRSAGHILQNVRGGHFLDELKSEWNEYREKGKIKDDYQESDQCWDNLKEILDSIDKDMPDRTRFKAMKSIFLNAATESEYDRSSILPYEFMKITRKLSSAQILILSSCYDIYLKRRDEYLNQKSYTQWVDMVLKSTGLGHREIIDNEERGLSAIGLITKRQLGDGSGVNPTDFRLTGLGLKICRFITETEGEQVA